MYLPQIKINRRDWQEYKMYLSSKGTFKATKLFCYHIIQLLINYIRLSKEQKTKLYICIYYNAADYPILTVYY